MISRKYSCQRVACCKVPHSRIDPDGQFLGRSGIRLSKRPDSPVGNLLPPCPGSPFSTQDGGTSENGKYQASLCSLTILRLTGQRPSASSAGASSTFTGRLGCEPLLLIRGRILVEAFVRSRSARDGLHRLLVQFGPSNQEYVRRLDLLNASNCISWLYVTFRRTYFRQRWLHAP